MALDAAALDRLDLPTEARDFFSLTDDEQRSGLVRAATMLAVNTQQEPDKRRSWEELVARVDRWDERAARAEIKRATLITLRWLGSS